MWTQSRIGTYPKISNLVLAPLAALASTALLLMAVVMGFASPASAQEIDVDFCTNFYPELCLGPDGEIDPELFPAPYADATLEVVPMAGEGQVAAFATVLDEASRNFSVRSGSIVERRVPGAKPGRTPAARPSATSPAFGTGSNVTGSAFARSRNGSGKSASVASTSDSASFCNLSQLGFVTKG